MYRIKMKKRLELLKSLSAIAKGDYRFFTPIVATRIRDDIIENINKQITPAGTRLKRNKPKTRKYKLKKLGHDKSLIWFRVLIDPSTWIAKGFRKKAQLRLKAKRRFIGEILERRGYHFFGISPWARKAIMDEFWKKIRQALGRRRL